MTCISLLWTIHDQGRQTVALGITLPGMSSYVIHNYAHARRSCNNECLWLDTLQTLETLFNPSDASMSLVSLDSCFNLMFAWSIEVCTMPVTHRSSFEEPYIAF